MSNGAGQPGANNTYRGQGGSSNSFRYLPPYGIGQPGSVVQGGGGGNPSSDPFFRDIGDSNRSMYRQTPEAQYPDGFLGGNIVSRQNDRLLDALRNRVNERSYTRGVHKGERISPADYIWPVEFTPFNGIKAEAAGHKQAPLYGAHMPTGTQLAESVLTATGAQSLATLAPNTSDQLRHLAPSWRW